MMARDPLIEKLRAALSAGQVLSDPEELLVYECDGLTHYRARPRAVVFPSSTDETARVVELLAAEGVPFAPRGAGTGLSGGALALDGGVCIELARMRRVLKLDLENRTATVETGTVNSQLSRAVAAHGLHYAPDPSSQATCTIGGNIAENAGGIHCLKYGVTVDHVTAARVVLSDGSVADLGGDGEGGGGGAGYDLLGLFVGSEGTFGIATEATVRLTPLAPDVRTLLADFEEVTEASRAVSAIIAAGIIPAALEMVDGETIRAVERSVFAAGLPQDAGAALLVELDGLTAGLSSDVGRVERIARECGARGVRLAADDEERKKLWAARKGAFGALGRISPDLMLQDTVVPRSRLPEVLAETYRIAARHRLTVANVFHAGDGNLHPFICYDSRDPDEVRRVKEAGREMMETAVRAGGTITGEHGVGIDKSDYLPLVFTADDLDAMLQVRAAFDPLGLCNPGKVIPELKGCGEARAVLKRAAGRAARLEDADGTNAGLSSSSPAPSPNAHESTRAQASPSSSSARSAVSSSTGAFVSSSTHETVSSSAHETVEHSRSRVARDDFGAFAAIAGAEHVQPDDGEGMTVRPASEEEAVAVLRVASERGARVVPAGARSWLDAGGPLACDRIVFVETARMSRIVSHEPADLVATAEAGVRLEEFNREVGLRGQRLPLDPPCAERATLGGVAATGLAGPQALGYGGPRAYVLGLRVALADGRTLRAGSRVVKNVAGYDLCKLFTGSYGTLGLIMELTFKLRPLPERERTVVARAANGRALVAAARAVISAPLLPVAAELLSPRMARALELYGGDDAGGHALLLRFAGSDETVEHQTARSRELLDETAPGCSHYTLDDDRRLWRELSLQAANAARELTWRAAFRPSHAETMLEVLRTHRGEDLTWHAGTGDGHLRVFEDEVGDVEKCAGALGRMREAARDSGGSLVMERAPAELKRALDPWGLPASTALLMRRIKGRLDPRDTFSPGRFPSV